MLDFEIKLENQEKLVQKADDIHSKYLRVGSASSNNLQIAPLNLAIDSNSEKIIENKVDKYCHAISNFNKNRNELKTF